MTPEEKRLKQEIRQNIDKLCAHVNSEFQRTVLWINRLLISLGLSWIAIGWLFFKVYSP